MSILKKSMLIEPHDNVAVAVEPIEAGEATMVGGEEIVANQFIKEGHKIARTDIAKGDEIIKYGVHIGVATQDIKKGDWVHENNVYDDFEEINQKQRAYYRSMAPDALDYTDPRIYTKEELHLPETIMGYKRADGSFGIRNQVLVISLVQCSNNAAQRISNACNVPATFVDAACGEFPDRFARTLKGFITAGTHPNTFGVVLLSLGCQQTNPEEVAEAIRKTEYRTDVIGSNTRLAGASLEMIDLPGREGRLRKALAEVQKDYDFIFIDCPPSLDLLTLNGLSACDSVLIPVQCEYYALEGLSELISTLKTIRKKYNPYLDIEGVVFTMFSLRYNLTVQVVEQVQKYFGSKVYKTTIPRSIRISEAPSYGQPINFYEPKGKGSEAYMDLAIEFVKHNRPQEPKKSRAKAAPAAEPAKNALED